MYTYKNEKLRYIFKEKDREAFMAYDFVGIWKKWNSRMSWDMSESRQKMYRGTCRKKNKGAARRQSRDTLH